MTDSEAIRERGHIEGRLSEWLATKINDEYLSMNLGGEDFRPLCLEDGRELGYGDDDPVILLRRKSDGAVFEVEIEPTVRRVGFIPLKSEQTAAAGQLPPPAVPE